MPRKCFCYNSDGTTEIKEIPTEEELRENTNEKYKNTIWKSKVHSGIIVRVSDWSSVLDNNGYFDHRVWFKPNNGFATSMDMSEFNFMYERLGKAKYTKEQLEKMEFEVQDENIND